MGTDGLTVIFGQRGGVARNDEAEREEDDLMEATRDETRRDTTKSKRDSILSMKRRLTSVESEASSEFSDEESVTEDEIDGKSGSFIPLYGTNIYSKHVAVTNKKGICVLHAPRHNGVHEWGMSAHYTA